MDLINESTATYKQETQHLIKHENYFNNDNDVDDVSLANSQQLVNSRAKSEIIPSDKAAKSNVKHEQVQKSSEKQP